MRIYWYWPHPHRHTSALALGAVRDGDSLTVQALPSLLGEVFGPVTAYRVVRDLPDPTAGGGAATRVVRRAGIAAGRMRSRRRMLRGHAFDVAHLHLLTYQNDWLDLPRLRRMAPLVATVHDVRPHRAAFPHRVESALLRRVYGRGGIDRLVVFHRVLKDELVADFGVEPERVSVVPIPVYAEDIGVPSRARGERPRALLFGRLQPYKGVADLLAAVRILGANDPGFDVQIVGAGDPALEARVREVTAQVPWVSARIARVSKLEQVQLVADASLLVLPYTEFHSQSGVLADAYANAVPLLVTDVGAIGPTVREDRTGWVVPPRDPAALAEGLHTAMREITAGNGRADALRRALDRHRAEAVGVQLRNIYDEVVALSGSYRRSS